MIIINSKIAPEADFVSLPCDDVLQAASTKPEPFLVSVEETCRLLNCGRTTIFALLSSGTLDRRKVGRATRVTMASIRRLAGI